jgi:hypothetical protein
MRGIIMLTGTMLFLGLTASADVLYKGEKAIALGKGTPEGNIIHWTYCDGKKDDFKKPPHKFLTGEHCKISPYAFGIIPEGGNYIVSDPAVFHNFFSGAAKGDKVTFSADEDSIRMHYKGQAVTLYRSGDHEKDISDKDPR